MKLKLAIAAASALAFAIPSTASAQDAGQAIVSIYHAAPGHQVELLKWLAQQDRIAAAAGQPASQIYVHTDGDSWDYMMIAPATTQAQDDAFDAAARKMGLPAGPRAGIELRKHIQSHTDTFVRGPVSAAQILTALGEK
jgi:ABC-type glycerol-3-phosphate transport system substrate-binding protein